MGKQIEVDGWIAEYNGSAERYGEFSAGKYIPVALNQQELIREYGNNSAWQIKPVCLVDPAEYERLLKVQEWAKNMQAAWQRDRDITPRGLLTHWLGKLQDIINEEE